MVDIESCIVENEIVEVVKSLTEVLRINAEVDTDCSPAGIGISSQVLITIMGRLEEKLQVSIPDTCYIFFDKENNKQLTIREAANKLIRIAKKDGK